MYAFNDAWAILCIYCTMSHSLQRYMTCMTAGLVYVSYVLCYASNFTTIANECYTIECAALYVCSAITEYS